MQVLEDKDILFVLATARRASVLVATKTLFPTSEVRYQSYTISGSPLMPRQHPFVFLLSLLMNSVNELGPG